MKLPSAANDNLIDRTIALWQSRVGHELTHEEARQVVENITGFFNVLAEWSRAEMHTPANDNGRPAEAVESGEAGHDR